MSTVRRLWHRLVAAARPHALDRELEEEIRSHIALAADEYVRRGHPRREAERLARLRFGSVAASLDAHRDARGLPSIEGWLFDLRLALRSLRRDWAVTLAAVAMLTLALGLNATVYSVMQAMLFRGLPLVPRSDRVVYLQEHYASGQCCIAYMDFEDWRAQASSFEGLAYVGERRIAVRDADERPFDMRVTTVSANAFGLMGVSPILGRDFVAADEMPGAPPVAILNHRFWTSRFGARPEIVGSTIRIDGAPATIVGVMPAGFDFVIAYNDDMWMPVTRSPDLLRRGLTPGLTVVGRLRDGVSLDAARAELQAINDRLAIAYPATNRGLRPRLVDHAEFSSGADARIIWGSLWVGACFVLLIASANVANLTLARTVGRWRELATKLALGAGQTRMVRQLMLEGLLIAAVAAMAAWRLTTWSVAEWAESTRSQFQTIDYAVRGDTLAYLVAISLLSAVLFSAAPIARVLQLGVMGALKGDARGVTAGLRGRRLSTALVAGQMALAIVLLSGAGVLVRSFANIVGAETGVRDPERVLVGLVRLPSERYPSADTRLQFFDRLAVRLAAVPGVETQSESGGLPVKFSSGVRTLEIEGKPSSPDQEQAVEVVTAGPGYFDVLGAPVIDGRGFEDADRGTTTPVAIVNERFATLHWPGERPIGKRFRVGNRQAMGEWRVVVGVVPNIMQGEALRQEFHPLVYVPFRQEPPARAGFFLARTHGDATSLQRAVADEIRRLDPDVRLEEFGTLQDVFAFDRDYMDVDHSELGKHAAAAPVFAGIALLLAAIGLAAVIAHAIGQRTKEIGVRMAIGAAARDIGWMILSEGMTPVLAGLAVGTASALAVNRLLRSQLVGVSPGDPLVLAAAALLLIAVALVACRIPARRAMTVDPVVALRHE